MKNILPIAALLLLGGCISNPFNSEEPVADNAAGHAEKVCRQAGEDSESCTHAKTQSVMRCYRTLGTVNCYTAEDPYGHNESARSLVQPIDGRKPTPSPG